MLTKSTVKVVAVICVLVAAVSAGVVPSRRQLVLKLAADQAHRPNVFRQQLSTAKVAAAFAKLGSMKKGKSEPEPEPEPCCTAQQTTYKSHYVVSELDAERKFTTEFVETQDGYDALGERIGLYIAIDFTNGTEDHVQVISNYKEDVEYYVLTYEGTTYCTKSELKDDFPTNCVPDDSKYEGVVTLGNRALKAGVWLFFDESEPNATIEVKALVQVEGCVEIGNFARVFNPETEEELHTVERTVTDFNLGIADPDFYFKPPEECKDAPSTVLDKLPKHFRQIRTPGLKRQIFK